MDHRTMDHRTMKYGEALHLGFVLGSVRATLLDGVVIQLREGGDNDVRRTYPHALAHLHGVDGATVATLGRHLAMTRQAAGQLVTELVGKGYVERRPHLTDGRAQEVIVSPSGEALLRAAEAAAATVARRWYGVITPERMEELDDDLSRIALLERCRRL